MFRNLIANHILLLFLFLYFVQIKPQPTNQITWTLDNYPNPFLNSSICGSEEPSRICDPVKVISYKERRRLDHVLNQIYKHSICMCIDCPSINSGFVVGLAFIEKIKVPHGETNSSYGQLFAEKLLSRWKMSSCGAEMILAVFPNMNTFFVSASSSLKMKMNTDYDVDFFESCKNLQNSSFNCIADILEFIHDTLKEEETIYFDVDIPKLIFAIVSAIFLIIILPYLLRLAILHAEKKKIKEHSKHDTAKFLNKNVFKSDKKIYEGLISVVEKLENGKIVIDKDSIRNVGKGISTKNVENKRTRDCGINTVCTIPIKRCSKKYF